VYFEKCLWAQEWIESMTPFIAVKSIFSGDTYPYHHIASLDKNPAHSTMFDQILCNKHDIAVHAKNYTGSHDFGNLHPYRSHKNHDNGLDIVSSTNLDLEIEDMVVSYPNLSKKCRLFCCYPLEQLMNLRISANN
jgi:hypothetical protein